ncbi:hypothetical protein PoB_004667200 [Plakobranchus ocellatus]|uniref:Uncharacterized protein n=1 Tax=Plakobranchus ocellatus TaxID=259542 RepID=A0AAV4BLH9_9GAST|nr:hypothetical protein PoB_004667200 [Plakobranchus ocellatus]
MARSSGRPSNSDRVSNYKLFTCQRCLPHRPKTFTMRLSVEFTPPREKFRVWAGEVTPNSPCLEAPPGGSNMEKGIILIEFIFVVLA